MAELEEKIRRLQADDKQKQISELMGLIEDLRTDNERLRGMTEKIRSLTETVGPTLKGLITFEYRSFEANIDLKPLRVLQPH
jgi:hypothetical protein